MSGPPVSNDLALHCSPYVPPSELPASKIVVLTAATALVSAAIMVLHGASHELHGSSRQSWGRMFAITSPVFHNKVRVSSVVRVATWVMSCKPYKNRGWFDHVLACAEDHPAHPDLRWSGWSGWSGWSHEHRLRPSKLPCLRQITSSHSCLDQHEGKDGRPSLHEGYSRRLPSQPSKSVCQASPTPCTSENLARAFSKVSSR